MTRIFLLTMLLVVSHSSFSLTNDKDWFQQVGDNKFRVVGEKIHPAALFKKLSIYSGIEIKYEKALYRGLDINLVDAPLKELLRYVDSNFSTFKTYLRSSKGGEVLSQIVILPKGQSHSSQLISAYDPLEEAVAYKKGNSSNNAEKIYVTRMEHMELDKRHRLEEAAERQIKRENQLRAEIKSRREKKSLEKSQLIAELKELKSTDPELFNHKLAVMAWRYPGLQDDVDNQDVLVSEDNY